MATKWHATTQPGVRYREHPSRKVGVQRDKYFVVRYRVAGRRYEEALGWQSQGWTARRAANELAKLKENHRLGRGPQTLAQKRELAQAERQASDEARKKAELESLTLSEIFSKHYLPYAKENLSPNTWRKMVWLMRDHIEPVIGEMALGAISPFHLEKIKREMAKKELAPKTIHIALSFVRRLFNWSKSFDLYAGENPVTKIKLPRTDNTRLRFLTKDEAEKLLNELGQRSKQMQEIALVSLHTGGRFAEIVGLAWSDIDLARGILTFRDTKNGESRPAYMTSEVKAILESKVPGKPNELVFQKRGGGRIEQVSRSFERAVKALKLNEGITDPRQKIVLHSLRHTFASWLVENGTDLYVVQRLLGHKTPRMTQRYAHLAPDKFRLAIQGFEQAINENKASDREALPGQRGA